MDRSLDLKIILQKPIAGVLYGIQKGTGTVFETLQKQTSNGNDLHFSFDVRVKLNKEQQPVFLGPFTQGPPQERFVYLDIGNCAGQPNTVWSRRLKIPLKNISKAMIEGLKPGDILLAEVAGKGKDGTPSCGTIKPFDGWKIVQEKK